VLTSRKHEGLEHVNTWTRAKGIVSPVLYSWHVFRRISNRQVTGRSTGLVSSVCTAVLPRGRAKQAEERLHSFLISALDVGEWSASGPGRFTAVVNWREGWVGPRARLGGFGGREICWCFCCIYLPVQSLYRLSYPGSRSETKTKGNRKDVHQDWAQNMRKRKGI
jgi:hypothetical protein